MTQPVHILLKHAKSYEMKPISLAPKGCMYNEDIGAWVVTDTGELFVNTQDKDSPKTKKNDIETGEDQKGE